MSSPDDTRRYDLLTPNVVKKDGYEIGIIREFDFSSQLQRMSVVVKPLDIPGMIMYAKGAPEKIRLLCHYVPDDFDRRLDSFTVIFSCLIYSLIYHVCCKRLQ